MRVDVVQDHRRGDAEGVSGWNEEIRDAERDLTAFDRELRRATAEAAEFACVSAREDEGLPRIDEESSQRLEEWARDVALWVRVIAVEPADREVAAFGGTKVVTRREICEVVIQV